MAFTVPRPSILVVNYPSNPTAETVDLAFYERLVAWAKENKVWILSDLAYSELYFDGNPTPAILQVKGGKDVAVEFTSLSKTIRWLAGVSVSLSATVTLCSQTRVKAISIMAHHPYQAAACAALNGPQTFEQNSQLYHKRRDILVEAFDAQVGIFPRACIDVCVGTLPPASRIWAVGSFQTIGPSKGRGCSRRGYGEDGEGYVRIARSRMSIVSGRPRAT